MLVACIRLCHLLGCVHKLTHAHTHTHTHTHSPWGFGSPAALRAHRALDRGVRDEVRRIAVMPTYAD